MMNVWGVVQWHDGGKNVHLSNVGSQEMVQNWVERFKIMRLDVWGIWSFMNKSKFEIKSYNEKFIDGAT